MGHIFFPLTPAISPGERENPPLSSGQARDGVSCPVRAKHVLGGGSSLSPGEGVRDEGKRRFDRHRLSHIQGTPQYCFAFRHSFPVRHLDFGLVEGSSRLLLLKT